MSVFEMRHEDDPYKVGGMSFGTFLATEGGRKCPQCGRYAKREELGYIGGRSVQGDTVTILTMYGHLPGFGCNVRGGGR